MGDFIDRLMFRMGCWFQPFLYLLLAMLLVVGSAQYCQSDIYRETQGNGESEKFAMFRFSDFIEFISSQEFRESDGDVGIYVGSMSYPQLGYNDVVDPPMTFVGTVGDVREKLWEAYSIVAKKQMGAD